jgi:Secretion system C-terminal sorting domain
LTLKNKNLTMNNLSKNIATLLVLLFPLLATAQWQRITTLPDKPFFALQQQGNALYAATYNQIYRSNDSGDTWISLPPVHNDEEDEITDLLVRGDTLYVSTLLQGCFQSNNGGQTWANINNGLSGLGSQNTVALAIRGDLLFVATSGAGVFARSLTASQPAWAHYGSGQPWGNVHSLTVDGSVLLAGAGGSATLSRQVEGNPNWQELPFDQFNGEINAFLGAVRDSNILVGAGFLGLYRSGDDGLTWSGQSTGIGFIERASFARFEGKIYVLMSKAASHFLRTSTDRGATWALPAINLPTTAGRSFDLMSHGNRLFCARENGVWKLDATVSGIEQPPIAPSPSVHIYPNPATDVAYVEFELTKSANVALVLTNTFGQYVQQFDLGVSPAGTQRQALKVGHWPRGVYLCNIVADGQVLMCKKMVVHCTL